MSRTATKAELGKVGNYKILEVIGKGATATVYKCQNPATEEILAIKVIHGRIVDDKVMRLRFAKECQVARKLDHPHVVQVKDFGLDGNKPYLVMEYVSGGSLGQRIEDEGRLPEAEAVRIITQAGEALQWAHERRLVHRDVKPDNILLDGDDQVKLSDLGLVKNLDDEGNLTKPLDALGTPNFMSPEQFQDASKADAMCDLYSLAATLYNMVTGEIPFRAHSAHAVSTIFKKKLENDLLPPRELVPEITERVSTAIMRALQADRAKRQISVRTFLGSLTENSVILKRPALAKVPSDSEVRRPGREKRAKKRFVSRRATTCDSLQESSQKPWVAKVVDISQTGVCLELNRRFERGVLLTILLEAGPIMQRSMVASVMWVKQLNARSWNVGCQFAQPLSELEIHSLR
jgi:serine/threonine protein kinase